MFLRWGKTEGSQGSEGFVQTTFVISFPFVALNGFNPAKRRSLRLCGAIRECMRQPKNRRQRRKQRFV
jgi:hypothetical protein